MNGPNGAIAFERMCAVGEYSHYVSAETSEGVKHAVALQGFLLSSQDPRLI